MANHHHNDGRDALPDDHRGTWRPQDQAPQASGHRARGHDDDDRPWRDRSQRDDDRRGGDRDPRRWEGGRGSEVGCYEDRDVGWRGTERYGQGQSGYSAGRHGDDRSQRSQNRNDMIPPGSFEERRHELGVDDRFTGRGRSGSWQDRAGHDSDHYPRSGHESRSYNARDAESDRISSRTGQRAYDERVGYHGQGQSNQQVGYQSSYYGQGYGGYGPRQQQTQDEAHRSSGTHVHRGVGPHRGRGPLGYQRSDERIREAVCESLTDDDQIDATQIEVSVRNGEVTLSGVVDDRRAKRNAEDCAYTISGVRDVQNLLRVRDDDRVSRSNLFPYGSVGNGDIETSQNGRKPRA